MESSPVSTPMATLTRTPNLESVSTDWLESNTRSLEMSSNASPIHSKANLPSIRGGKDLYGADRRFDRAYTLSWAKKQDEMREQKLRLLSNSKSTQQLPTQTVVSPLTKKNRRFVVHLSSEADNQIHKVPLYKNEVFEIRQQNDRILKQILASKHEYIKGYNDIAEQNRFNQFRSISVHPRASQASLHSRSSNNSPDLSESKPVSSSLQFSILRTEKSKTNETKEDINFSTQGPNLDEYVSTLPNKPTIEKSRILEGLEKIYYKDLKKKKRVKDRSQSLSPGKLGIGASEEVAKEAIHLKNFRNFIADDVLMGQLQQPYAKKLPFEKPEVGNVKHSLIRELHAIETKAEVLRNIKLIETSMAKEANSIGNLPKIKENPDEDEIKEKVRHKTPGGKQRPKKKSYLPVSKKESENLKFWAKQIANK